MRSKLALAAALSTALFARAALADEEQVAISEEAEAPQPHMMELPDQCQQFATVAEDTFETTGWSQILSLASCVQDTSPVTSVHGAQISEQIELIARRQVPALAIYLQVVESAPVPVQLAATYHIGLAQLAMVTRARSAVVTPDDFATNPRARARHKKLQAEIDASVEPMMKIAWTAFAMVVAVADDHPELVRDPVMKANVAFARRSLRWMHEPKGVQTVFAML